MGDLDLRNGGSAGTWAPVLDLRKEGDAGTWAQVHEHSQGWAAIAKPFAWFVFTLVGLVIVVPFILIWANRAATTPQPLDTIMRWAMTVLAPVVGFGSAVVGYYFGTSGAKSDVKTEREPVSRTIEASNDSSPVSFTKES